MLMQLTPRTIVYIFFKRRRAVIGFLLLCLVLNAVYIYASPWKYESEAQLMVKVNFNNPDLARAEFGNNGPNGGSPSMPQVSDDVLKSIVGSYKSMASSQDIERATIEQIGIATMYPELIEHPPTSGGTIMDKAIEKLDDDLDVTQLKESNILQVAVFNTNPRVAQRAVTTLLGEFIALQQKVFRPAETTFLEGQLGVANTQAQTEAANLRDFKVGHKLSSAADEREQLLQQRTDISDTLANARSALGGAEARKAALDAALRDFQAHATSSSGTDAMSRQLDDAQARLTAQLERANAAHTSYPEGSPFVLNADKAVADARKRLQDIQQQIDRTVRSGASPVYQALQTDMLRNDAELAAARAQVASISRDVEAINARLSEISGLEGDLKQLETRAQVAHDNLTTQLQRVEESRISTDLNKSQITSLTVVQKPTLGYKVVRPRWKLTSALALLLGVFGGLLFAFLRESLGETYALPEQLARESRVPLLATLNLIQVESR